MIFHNEEYDGIVLKIPRGFIATNPDLIPAIDEFHKKLKSCEFSIMHPDHERNLKELKYRTEKQGIVQQKKEEREKLQRIMKKRNKDLVNHIILPISYRTFTDGTVYESITIGKVDYSWEQITTKTGIKTKTAKAYSEYISKCNFDEFMYFLKDSRFTTAVYIIENIPKAFVKYRQSSLYINSYGNIAISIQLPVLHIYHKGERNDKMYYRDPYLEYDKKQNRYHIIAGLLSHKEEYKEGGSGWRSYLDDYELKGNQFIKKEIK